MYYAKVTTPWGMRLSAGTSLQDIRSEAVAEEGQGNVESVSWAKEDDVIWVAAMGGKVPKDAIVKPQSKKETT